jgi:transcriptional regulator with XRE-family HTH domain
LDHHLPPGERIRICRRRLGLTQEQCAQLKGCTVSTWRKWESGERNVTALADWVAIARILRVHDLYQLTGLPVNSLPDGPTEHPAVPAIRAAMLAYVARPAGEPQAEALARAVDGAWALWQERRPYGYIGSLLPSLITEVRGTVPVVSGEDQRAVLRTTAMLYFLVRAFTKRVGAHEVSLLAVDRAMAAAARAEDLDHRAVAAWNIGMTLSVRGHADVVVALARDAAAELEPVLSGAPPARQSAFGLLQLLSAIQLARLGDERGALAAVETAENVAADLGDRNDFHTMFGPANVNIHRVCLALELSRPAEAIRAAQRYDVAAVPTVERRFSHYVYLARAYSIRSEDVAATHMLLCAERESAEDLRYNAEVRAVMRDLMRRHSPVTRTELLPLADRIGVLR